MTLQPNLIERTLDFLHENGYDLSPKKFLELISKYLSETLNINYVLISQYSHKKPLIVESIVFYGDRGLKPSITYNLENAPCQNVIDKEICVYKNNIQNLFPLDKGLAKMNVNSYIGIPLWGSNKEPIGLLAFMDNKPLEEVETIKVILKIVSIKIEKVLEKILYEKEVRENEIKFTELSNLSFEGVLIHSNNEVIDVNKAFEEMFGYSRKELIEIGAINFLFPKKYHAFIEESLEKEKEASFEFEGIRKDGSIFPIEAQTKSIKSKNNELIQVCVLKNLTKRKKIERERIKLSSALEQSANVIVITNKKGEIEYTNPKFSKVTGYSSKEVNGKNPRILNSGIQTKEFYNNFWKTISSGNIWSGQFQNIDKYGKLFWEQATVTPIKDKGGEIINYLAIKEDITESKKSELELKNAYHTIQEKEDYLRNILRTANEGFWIIDFDASVIDINNKMCDMLGFTEDEIKGTSIYEYVDQANAQIFKDQLRKRENGIADSYEIELKNKKGENFICLFKPSSIFNKENKRIGSFALVTDISNIKSAYNNLENKNLELSELSERLSLKNKLHKESKDRFQKLFEQSPVSLWDIDLSKVKELIISNNIGENSLEDYFEYNEGFLKECISQVIINKINKVTLNLFGVKTTEELKKLLREKNKTQLLSSLKKVFLAIQTSNKNQSIETSFVKNNGDIIYSIIKFEIDPDSKAIVSAIDVSALKKIEYELNKSKIKTERSDERYRLAVAATGLGIWDWDISSNSIYYSSYYKKQLGYEHYEFENKISSWRNHLHPDDAELHNKNLLNYLKNPVGQYISEFRLRHKDGSYIWILARAEVLKNEKGEAIRMFGSHRDISVRKRALLKLDEQRKELVKAKEKAEESNRLKTEFLHNMSHEIRTPMNGILGFSNFLSDPALSDEKRHYYINIIQNSGNQLLRVIDDILEISRLETKQVKVIENPVCINDLLLELFSIFDLKAKENGIPIYVKNEHSDQDSTIFTDRSKLNKVLSNLLENALKYTNRGYIKFGYNIIENRIDLFVKDTGIGICKTKQESIFERFSQEEKNMTLNSGGLGLGLSIAKENTELLGGQISIISEKGEGSKFIVSIPYKPVNELLANDTMQGAPVNKPNKFTVLIAEDEEVNFMFIEILLTEKIDINIDILHAKNGKEAVNMCKTNDTIDLVLMDINMPILNGYEATKQIRNFKPNLPIIAQTAYSTIEDKEKAKKAGCNNFISKPIKEKSLNDLMKSFLIEEKFKKEIS